MRLDCYRCGGGIKVVDGQEGEWVQCSRCAASALVPATTIQGQERRHPSQPQPVVLPVMISTHEDWDLAEERAIDLREMRRYRNEDRAGNPVGIAGLALGATTLLFLFGAALLSLYLPVYLCFVAILSVPAALAGLVCSIIGSLLVGRPKLFSLTGAGIGAFLIVAGIPFSFLLLKSIWS